MNVRADGSLRALTLPPGGLRQVSGTCPHHGQYSTWALTGRAGVNLCPECARIACEKALVRAVSRRVEEGSGAAAEGALRRMGIPRRFWGKTFSSFRVDAQWQREVLAGIEAIADGFASSAPAAVLMSGPPGTGKTHLATALCVAVSKRTNAVCRYWHANELLGAYIDARNQSSYASARSLLVSPDLLVIDEVMLNTSDAVKGLLQQVVEVRYAEDRPVVLVGNFPNVGALFRFLGARCTDRLSEQSLKSFVFNGPSQRDH